MLYRLYIKNEFRDFLNPKQNHFWTDMDANIVKPISTKIDSLAMQSLKLVVDEMSDEDKSSLLELIYKPKDEPDITEMNIDHVIAQNLSVGRILIILRDIDMRCRTKFSARIYFTGDIYIFHKFDEKACYNEIGVIANCKLVGQVLLRLLRYFYRYPDEEDIEELLQCDKEHFDDTVNEFGGNDYASTFIKFLASLETEFISDNIITSDFTTQIYNRKDGTTVYETDISKVDVWTIARLYSELYGYQIYDRKIADVNSDQPK